MRFGNRDQDHAEDPEGALLKALVSISSQVALIGEQLEEFKRQTVIRLDRADPAGVVPDPSEVDAIAEERTRDAFYGHAQTPGGRFADLTGAGLSPAAAAAQAALEARSGWSVVMTDVPGDPDATRLARELDIAAAQERVSRSVPGKVFGPGID